MICPNCGTKNEETYQFCMKCGTSLSGVSVAEVELPSPSEQIVVPAQPAALRANGRKSKDLLKDKITPAEGEVSVRTYYCTYYLSRLLGLEASGYLGITNKRVIFQALGTSNAGSSVIQSELPIADVSGISSYKGTFFSFGHMAAALFASWIASSFAFVFITIFGSAIIALIAGITRDLESSANSLAALPVIGWILGIGGLLLSSTLARHSIWRSVLAAIASVGFVVAGGGSLLGGIATSFLRQAESSNGTAALAFFLAFITFIYVWFCVFWYARRPTFSLAISSKGGSDTPINISGASGLGLFSVSAGKALTAEPAPEAELMLEELGAVILDVQTLGDMGINKWKTL
jgi:hypothetical protein